MVPDFFIDLGIIKKDEKFPNLSSFEKIIHYENSKITSCL